MTPASFEMRFPGLYTQGPYTTLEDWYGRLAAPDKKVDYFFQMDITGAEYNVIISTPLSILRRFRIMVIEFFHYTEVFAHAAARPLAQVSTKLVLDFLSVHLHANNGWGAISNGTITIPKMIEATFLRRDYTSAGSQVICFPYSLGRKCVPERDELPLDATFCR